MLVSRPLPPFYPIGFTRGDGKRTAVALKKNKKYWDYFIYSPGSTATDYNKQSS